MPSRKKKKDQLSEEELERRQARFLLVVTQSFGLARLLVVCLALVLFAYYGFYLPVAVSHGETTSITMAWRWIGDVKFAFGWAATTGTTAWAMIERKRRKKGEIQASKRITLLEETLQKQRSSL
jgi:hypothetical protein